MVTLQTNNCQTSLHKAIEQVEESFSVSFDKGDKKEKLLLYFSLLYQWNKSINLTGIKEPELLVYKHLGDTLLFDKLISPDVSNLLDIGTGAGIPGLLLKILRPNLNVVLAEAIKKKCSFLRYVASLLRLKDIFIDEKRISPPDPPTTVLQRQDHGFDTITSLAAGSLRWLIDTSLPFLSSGGQIVTLKGPSIKKELHLLRQMAGSKGVLIKSEELTLPILEHKRVALIIEKDIP